MLTIGSLCSGIGGLDIAAEQHFGATLSWHSDIDPQANAVMKHHWPNALGVGDFTATNPSSLPSVDILTCGFPCQPVSIAGLKLGTEDDRWLFDDVAEFIPQLPQLPKVLVLENVQGFLSNNKGKTARRVVSQVVSLGYRISWGMVRASDAGLPHQRSRWFAVATTPDTDHPGRSQQCRTIPVEEKQSSSERGGSAGWGPYAAAVESAEQLFGPAPDPLIEDRLNPRLVEWVMGFPPGWTTDVIPRRTHSIRLLGNSVCPPQASLALALLTQ